MNHSNSRQLIVFMFLNFVLLTIFPFNALASEEYVFERMWPLLEQPWYFYPNDIATDGQENVYVADNEHRIQKFSSSGALISKWGSPGSGDGQFKHPKGIAIDGQGNVYVADTNNDRIQKFTSSGEFITKWGTEGSADGQFKYPSGIAIDDQANVYVADTDNYRIQKLTSSGDFIAKWGSIGDGDVQFNKPSGIEIDSHGNLYVADLYSGRIKKFTSSGEFITKWGTIKVDGIQLDDGELNFPHGISVDIKGNVYVADTGNHRIQKFTSSGEFITKWGSAGNGDGQFNLPYGIALDQQGNVYVTDYLGRRLQKFSYSGEFIAHIRTWVYPDLREIEIDSQGDIYVTEGYWIEKLTSSGEFITRWGGEGSADGQFGSAAAIAIDDQANVYVVDGDNHRIQKFTSSGEFITKWGSEGSADGQFNYPHGIAIDDQANVYVADTDNSRIQKFTSSGNFITKWNVRFSLPQGIAIDEKGDVFLASGGDNRIKKFSPSGEFITEFGAYGSEPGFLNDPYHLALTSNGKVYVTDMSNHRIQIFKPVTTGSNNKAIILAGGGAFAGNNLWDSTQMCANFAYRTLTYQGFTKERIYYLTSDIDLDLDSNGVLDDVDGDATNSNLQHAITQWALDADSVVIYLTDHGGNGTFRMSGTETLAVTDVNTWLNTLQTTMPGKVVVIYDACESGSFLASLKPPAGEERVVITSTSPGEQAKFVTQGSVSFSNYFWIHIFNGLSIRDAFDRTEIALGISFNDQHALMDANGNGVGNEAADYTLTQNAYVGNGTIISGDAPVIGSVSPVQTISGKNSAPLYAASVTDDNGIGRVWAVIRPPDYVQGNSGNPVTSLPSIDLMPVGDGRYEGTYTGFNLAGTYQIAIYAMDRIGNTSIPELTTVSVENPLRRRAILVAGGPSTESFWPAFETNAKAAYEALSFQGYSNEDIYFMSPVAFSVGVDGLPTLGNVEDAVTRWAQSSTQDLVMYLIGSGGNGTFKLNENQNLSAADLDRWLDTLQGTIPGKVTVIYEACLSGSFLPLLTPPSGKERILISSASDAESAYFLSGGDVSFSKFFWSQVANGSNVRNAFLQGRDAIKHSCKGQTPQMDDNGNGVGNDNNKIEGIVDGILARTYTIGFGIMLGGDDPIIGSVSPSQALSGETSATLWAENVTSTNTISKVWAVITPPGYSGDPSSPVTDLPIVTLTHAGGGRYEGSYSGFSSIGTYAIAIHAIDQDGNVSPGKETTVSQTAGLEGCPGCGGDDVTISNKVFDSKTNCECRASRSITLSDNVTIQGGANIIFSAPTVTLKSMFRAEPGATVRIKQE